LSTDRQTDGHGETSIPPYNFVAGGITKNKIYTLHNSTSNNKVEKTMAAYILK